MALVKHTASITTAADGTATVYAGLAITGPVVWIRYVPGTIATGGDLTITGNTTGVPILTKADCGVANVCLYPRVIPNKVTDGSAFTDVAAMIWVFEEKIKVVVAQGGATKSGSIEFYVDEVK